MTCRSRRRCHAKLYRRAGKFWHNVASRGLVTTCVILWTRLKNHPCRKETECSGRCIIQESIECLPPTGPYGRPLPNSDSAMPCRTISNQQAGLDLDRVEEAAPVFFAKGLADSTQKTHRTGKERYLKLCRQSGLEPIPLVESNLCSFVSFLALESLKHRSIKVYLSAVRHMQISEGLADPFQGTMLWLEYVLKGIKQAQAEEGRKERTRHPVTPTVLRQLKWVWDKRVHQWDTRLICAAYCLCYFAFLRIGEITVPSDAAFDPTDHLTMADIAVDKRQSPCLLKSPLSAQKSTRLDRECHCSLARWTLTSAQWQVSYLKKRGTTARDLFKYTNYCSHSFRIGAVTTGAKSGIEDCVIKTLGRWESLAYLQYVKTPRTQLTSYTKRLIHEGVDMRTDRCKSKHWTVTHLAKTNFSSPISSWLIVHVSAI